MSNPDLAGSLSLWRPAILGIVADLDKEMRAVKPTKNHQL
jgi:hypothetical protein